MPARRSSTDAIPVGDEVISRVFAAPRSLVFEVWTNAEHFTRWFGPHGTRVVDCEIDARPGGVIRFGHRFSDGKTIYVSGTFVEVVRDERIVFTSGFVDEHARPIPHPMFPDWPLDVAIEMTVLLDDVDGGTRVRVMHHPIPVELASHPATKRWSPMAREGSTQVLERLGEYLSLATSRKDA